MTLGQRQENFAGNLAKLLAYIYHRGYSVRIGEVWRTPEMADMYAKRGIGIRGSQHCKKLAADLNLFLGNTFLTDTAHHKEFGEYWMSLNPENRWGGDWDMDHLTEEGEDDGNHYEMKG